MCGMGKRRDESWWGRDDRLWRELSYKLGRLYKDIESRDKCISYLMFKMECAREQEALGWRIDIDKARTHLQQLEEQIKQHQLQFDYMKCYLDMSLNTLNFT